MAVLVAILVVVDLRPKVLFYHHDVIRNKEVRGIKGLKELYIVNNCLRTCKLTKLGQFWDSELPLRLMLKLRNSCFV